MVFGTSSCVAVLLFRSIAYLAVTNCHNQLYHVIHSKSNYPAFVASFSSIVRLTADVKRNMDVAAASLIVIFSLSAMNTRVSNDPSAIKFEVMAGRGQPKAATSYLSFRKTETFSEICC